MDIIFVYFFMPETLKPENRSKSFVNSAKEAFDLINPSQMFTFRSGQCSKTFKLKLYAN